MLTSYDTKAVPKRAWVGWDGKIKGRLQPTGTFAWMVRAIGYTGAAYFQKGVVTLL